MKHLSILKCIETYLRDGPILEGILQEDVHVGGPLGLVLLHLRLRALVDKKNNQKISPKVPNFVCFRSTYRKLAAQRYQPTVPWLQLTPLQVLLQLAPKEALVLAVGADDGLPRTDRLVLRFRLEDNVLLAVVAGDHPPWTLGGHVAGQRLDRHPLAALQRTVD